MITRLFVNSTTSIISKLKKADEKISVRLSLIPTIFYQDLITLLKISLFFYGTIEAATTYFSSNDKKNHYKLEFADGIINVQNCTTIPPNATVLDYELISNWSKPTTSSAQLYHGVGEGRNITLENCVSALVEQFITAARIQEEEKNHFIGSIIGYCSLGLMFVCGVSIIVGDTIKRHRKEQKQAVTDQPSSPQPSPTEDDAAAAPAIASNSASEVSAPTTESSTVSTPTQSEAEDIAISPKFFALNKERSCPHDEQSQEVEQKTQNQLN